MRDLLKRLGKMVVAFGAVQWAGPFLSLIFTPIITRALNPSDYGVADYLGTISQVLSILALLAVPQAITAHFNDKLGDLTWQRTVTSTAFVMVAGSSVLIGGILFLLAPLITHYLSILGPYTNLVRLVGLTFVISATASVLTTSAQSALRVRWGVAFSATTIIATIVGNLLFIVVLRLGVTGMVLTPIFASASVWIVAMALTHRTIGKPAIRVARMLLVTGGVLLPTSLAWWVLQLSDRLFLAPSVSETELGYYAIANRMASLVYVALVPVFSVWTPLALAVQHQPNSLERYVTMSRYLVAAALMAGLGIGLFAIEILIILTRPAYFPAAPYVGFLAYAHVFGAFGIILYTGAMMGKQLGSISIAVVTGAIVNIILNAILIPRYGLGGATAATIVGYAVPQVVLYFLVQRRYPIPYPIGRFLSALLLQFGLLAIGTAIPPLIFPIRILVKSAILLMLPVGYVVLGIISPYEVGQGRLFLNNQIRCKLASIGLK